MKVRTIDPEDGRLAEHKLQIIHQQQLAAELIRQGKHERAKQVRAKLMQLLFKLDCMQALRR